MNQQRQNFYNGQKVLAHNLNDIQNYVEDKNAHLISHLMGYGIIEGFTLTKENDMIVSVSGGLAYSEHGINLVSNTGCNLTFTNAQLPSAGERIMPVALQFIWDETGHALDSTGNAVTTHWNPSVKLVCEQEITPNDLIIANVILTPIGISEIIKIAPNFLAPKQLHDKVATIHSSKTENGTIANIIADQVQINNTNLLDVIQPIGSFYTQYPEIDGTFNENHEPSVLYGGVWSMIHNDGVFFRTSGAETHYNESRQGDGIQLDAMKKLTGDIQTNARSGGVAHIFSYSSGIFSRAGKTSSGNVIDNYSYSTPSSYYAMNFDNSRQSRTSTQETRPKNMLIQIWQRIS